MANGVCDKHQKLACIACTQEALARVRSHHIMCKLCNGDVVQGKLKIRSPGQGISRIIPFRPELNLNIKCN